MPTRQKNLLLLFAVIILAVLPFFVTTGKEFSGADGQAEELISQISPDYQPWFASLFEPKSGEIESLLFCLQTALGAGFIGFYCGRLSLKETPMKTPFTDHHQ